MEKGKGERGNNWIFQISGFVYASLQSLQLLKGDKFRNWMQGYAAVTAPEGKKKHHSPLKTKQNFN